MKKIISYILTPLFYFVFGFFFGFFHLIQVFTFYILGYKAHKLSVDILNFCLIQSLLILGIKMKFKNFKDLKRDHPIVFISNHQSQFEIPGLIWGLRKYHMKFIAKKELGVGIPSITFNLKHGGSVMIDRDNPELAKKQISFFTNYIKENNYSICIFPEGKRSGKKEMRPFKVGGVKTILENIPDALIVPIAISGSWRATSKGNFPLVLGGEITLEMLEPRTVKLNTLAESLNGIQEEIKSTIHNK